MQPSRHILHFNGARLDTRNVVSAILNMYGYRILARLVQIATEYLPAFHCLQTSFLSFIGRHINKRYLQWRGHFRLGMWRLLVSQRPKRHQLVCSNLSKVLAAHFAATV